MLYYLLIIKPFDFPVSLGLDFCCLSRSPKGPQDAVLCEKLCFKEKML